MTEFPANRQAFEDWVVANATGFTCVWKKGPGHVQRQDFKKLSDAVEARAGHPRKMVYAVAGERSVCIAPKDFDRYIKQREFGK